MKWTLALVIILFILIKLPSIGPKISDENYLWYSAKLLSEGVIPYKDFLFASPPLQIIIQSFLIKLIGFHLEVFKFLPILYSAITSFFVYLYLKDRGWVTAFLATALYLFSFLVLTTTDHDTGVHLLTMLVFLSFYFSSLLIAGPATGFPPPSVTRSLTAFLAGALGGLAVLTRLYALPAVLAILVFLFLTKNRQYINFAAGFILTFVLPMIILGIFLPHFWQDIIGYHLLKSEGIVKSHILAFFVRWDWFLLLGTAVYFWVEKKRISLIAVILVFQALFYLIFADIYYLYLVVIAPFLAIFAAGGAVQLFKTKRWDINLLFVGVIVLSSYNAFNYLKDHSQTSRITQLNEITDFVKNNSNPEDRIYGSYAVTPLVALTADRTILNNFVDTNAKTFRTGTADVKNRINEISGKVKFFITLTVVDPRNREILRIDPESHEDFIRNECRPAKSFELPKDYDYNMIIIWDCILKKS